jgi:hypothetical protein
MRYFSKDIRISEKDKDAVDRGSKTTSIRAGELGRYVKGKTYPLKSFSGKDLGLKVKVTDVERVTLKDLNLDEMTKRKLLQGNPKNKNPFLERLKFRVVGKGLLPT